MAGAAGSASAILSVQGRSRRKRWKEEEAVAQLPLADHGSCSRVAMPATSRRWILDPVGLLQNQASDQWAYLSGQSIKEYLYELQHEKLKLSSLR